MLGEEMKTLYTTLGIFSLIGSIVFGIFAVIYLMACFYLIPHTIENGKTINHEFFIAATWVEGFAKQHERLPKQKEFNAWAKPNSGQLRWVIHMRLITSSQEVPEEVIKAFGHLPAGGYVLQVWRGEWFEYFSSWKQSSTVDKPLSLWKSTILVSLAFLFGSAVCWYLFRWCRRIRYSGELLKTSLYSSTEV